MRPLFFEFARLEPNTGSHVSHHCTLDLLDWREKTRVSSSRLPVFLLAPSSPEPLRVVIASGLGTPHGSRKQQSHFTSWYTVALCGRRRVCYAPPGAYLPHSSPPNVLACKRHFHHVYAAHISSSSSSPQRFPSPVQRPSPYSP